MRRDTALKDLKTDPEQIELAMNLAADGIGISVIARVLGHCEKTIAPLSRGTWSLAKSQENLLLLIHWWQAFYYLARFHRSLHVPVPGLERRYQQRTPAMPPGSPTTSGRWVSG